MKLCRIGELGKEKPAIIDKDGSYKDLSKVMHEAFQVATSGRPGPVLVDIPKDIQFAKTSYLKPKKENKKVVHDLHLCLKKIPTKWVEDEAQTRPNLVFKI